MQLDFGRAHFGRILNVHDTAWAAFHFTIITNTANCPVKNAKAIQMVCQVNALEATVDWIMLDNRKKRKLISQPIENTAHNNMIKSTSEAPINPPTIHWQCHHCILLHFQFLLVIEWNWICIKTKSILQLNTVDQHTNSTSWMACNQS